MAFGQPLGDCGVEFVEMAREKVVGVFDDNQPVFSRQCRHGLFYFFSRTEIVVGPMNKKLRLEAIRQKRKVAAVHRDADPDQFADARIAAADAKTHETPEAEACKQEWNARKLCSEIVEGGLHIALLAAPVVVHTAAQASTAKIKAQHRDAQGVHGFRSVINHLVVHGAAKE